MRCALLILALLTGCATPPGEVVPVSWVQLDSVKDRCGADAAACYRWINGVCTVYTRKPAGPYDEPLHNALGHETRHCFAGDFHPRDRYLNLNALVK